MAMDREKIKCINVKKTMYAKSQKHLTAVTKIFKILIKIAERQNRSS